jgi:ribonucleoside-diphosphate reductase alpha chain
MVSTRQTDIRVTKRDGGLESVDVEKYNKVISWACEGISGVSASMVALNSQVQFYDKIKTSDLMETSIKAAADLITEETPRYQYVAGRLINYHLRKQVYGKYQPDALLPHIERVIDLGYYDAEIMAWYTPEEIAALGNHIDHDRDFTIAYVGMEQFRGKYLIKNRVTGDIYETPQMAYMLIAMTLFRKYPKETRLRWVRDYYDAISTFVVSLPTPIMAGLRSPQKQFSSCVLIETDDSLDSINATASSIVKYVSQKAGIGIGAGRIRAIGSAIRNGDASHTGVIPFYKHFQSAVKSCSQGGVRGGAATLYYPLWHLEVEDLLVLKNNKGTEDNRIRHLDYGVQFNRVMYERLLSGGNITLFSPHDVPDMYEAFFTDTDRFKELYERYERSTKIRKKVIPAIELFSSFMQERKDTGRIYLMNVDHINDHGAFIKEKAPIRMSNLCLTGDSKLEILHSDGKREHISLSSFVELFAYGSMTGVKVRSYDTSSSEYMWADVTAAALTATATELIEIEDENGNVIRCTPDHLIWTKNRGWIAAKDLDENDVLCAEI